MCLGAHIIMCTCVFVCVYVWSCKYMWSCVYVKSCERVCMCVFFFHFVFCLLLRMKKFDWCNYGANNATRWNQKTFCITSTGSFFGSKCYNEKKLKTFYWSSIKKFFTYRYDRSLSVCGKQYIHFEYLCIDLKLLQIYEWPCLNIICVNVYFWDQ